MKLHVKITIIFLFLTKLLFSQQGCANSCTLVNNLDISTGYDPNTGTIGSAGTVDPLYRLANLPPITGSYGSYPNLAVNQSYIITPINNIWNNTGAGVLSPNNIANFRDDNAFPSQPFRLVREFCVCEQTNANINLNLRGDDSARVSIYFQNNPTPIYTYNVCQNLSFRPHNFPHGNNRGSRFHFYGNHTDNQILTLRPGTYTIEIEVQNSDQGSMGVSLNGSITAANGNNVLSHPANCCQSGTIYAQKILDDNCNGQFNSGDRAQQGVTFNLLNSNNQIVGTQVSDINGEVFFRNVPFGSYTLQEVVPNNFIPFSSLTQSVVVSASAASHYLTFYNCRPELRIRKVLDNNCDGVLDANDQVGGAGWTFDVFNGNSLIGTAITDNSGIATLTGLPSGTYTIVERINTNSTYVSPFQNNITVNYNQNINNPTVDVFNCQPVLNILKILDNNCNGSNDAGDQIGGAGWTFDIMQGNTIVQSATTDNTGVARFLGLVSGNYTIVERPRGGSSHPNPFQNNIPLNYNSSNLNQTVGFFNCLPPPFPVCCDNPIEIELSNEGQVVDAPTGIWNSEPFSMVQDEFTITSNSVIPITEFRAVVTDLDFEYNYESCSKCINNPALWGSIGGSLYVGNKLTNTNTTTNILNDRINRREIIWEENDGAMLTNGDTFNIDYALPPLSEIPCCVTSVNICIQISYKDANCVVCTKNFCRTINLSSEPEPINALAIDVEQEDCCNRKLTANADTAANFKWSTGETSKSIVVSSNGAYTVTASSGGNTISETIIVNDIMSGNFPLLSFNSLFHPSFVPPNKNKFYIMDISPGKLIQGVPNSYNANEYKLDIWHRWNTSGGQGQPLKSITGKSCSGFNNWDIYWDGTDQNGNSLAEEKSDSYIWRLTLKNCNNQSSKLTYRTSWVPVCEEYRYLFPKKKWIRLGCKRWGGYWKTETFEFGDVQMTK